MPMKALGSAFPPADAADWRRRATVPAAIGATAIVLCAVTGQYLGTRSTPVAMILVHGALFGLCVALWLALLQAPWRRVGPTLLFAALAARLALLPFPPSDDVARYLWEGQRTLSGDNVYAQPAADAPREWRDAAWEAMNHKDKLTAYPPLAQVLFALCVAIDDGALSMKLLFIAAEMAMLLLLLSELRRRHLPEANLALVAFNPVLLLSTAAEGHFDSVFVLAMLLALSGTVRRRAAPAWIWLAIAVNVKIVAIVLAPLLLRFLGSRRLWIFPAAVALPAIPFLGDLSNLVRGTLAFGTTTYHNGFIHQVALHLLNDQAATVAIAGVLLASWICLVTCRVSCPWRGGFLILGGLLLLTPVTHFWYFTWIAPFLALLVPPAWLLITGSQAFYFIAWAHAAVTGGFSQPPWAWWAQWLPFALVLIISGRHTFVRLLAPPYRRWPTPPVPISVCAVVPVHNEAEVIGRCLAGLRAQQPPLSEIIVVDGGSTDGTPAIASGLGARVISGFRGRGTQIALGVRRSDGDVIWIVHADAIPAPGSVAAILGALAAEPAAAGGALGQRFAAATPGLMAIEWLNAGRSALSGLSFGDQGQFVRRAALPGIGGFPDIPLMEDVELGLRLVRAGPTLHLGINSIISPRRWRAGRHRSRAWLIIRLTARYLLSRRRPVLARRLYEAYYGAKPIAVECPTAGER
jgi:hypothetical protein